MPTLILFTDGSVNTKTRIGFGAYLAVTDLDSPVIDLTTKIKVKKVTNTSSTKLELQTLLWAINDAALTSETEIADIVIYTDSQNIVGLPARRSGLEQRGYYSGNGRRLNNTELYQQFYAMMEHYNYQIIKVAGHKPKQTKNTVDKLFSLVDNASRSALRAYLAEFY